MTKDKQVEIIQNELEQIKHLRCQIQDLIAEHKSRIKLLDGIESSIGSISESLTKKLHKLSDSAAAEPSYLEKRERRREAAEWEAAQVKGIFDEYLEVSDVIAAVDHEGNVHGSFKSEGKTYNYSVIEGRPYVNGEDVDTFLGRGDRS